MQKKRSPDRLLLRWYLIGVLFIAIMTVVICGFSVVHKANTASGFAEPETLFELAKGADGEIYVTVFGEKYRLENRFVLPAESFRSHIRGGGAPAGMTADETDADAYSFLNLRYV